MPERCCPGSSPGPPEDFAVIDEVIDDLILTYALSFFDASPKMLSEIEF